MVCLALELIGSWVELGFSVGMEAFDELLPTNVPWSQNFWVSLTVKNLLSINLDVLSSVLYG